MGLTFILVDSNKVIGLNDASFESLISELSKLGLEQTEKSDFDIYIAINHNKNIYSRMNQPQKVAKKVLIRLEPYSVFPAQYSSKIESKYDIVISPGSVNDFKNSSYFIGFPHSIQKNPAKPTFKNQPSLEAFIEMNSKTLESNWRNRNLLCSMVAANKVSITRNSNYKLRRQLASKFNTEKLQIFGPLWNDPLLDKLAHRVKTLKFNVNYGSIVNLIEVYGNLFKKYPHAKGIIEDKYSVLFNSKFSLVVENSMEYVSEKIFDVFV